MTDPIIDLGELEALAAAAQARLDHDDMAWADAVIEGSMTADEMSFASAASPSTVAALCADHRRLTEALEAFCRAYASADGCGAWMTQPIHDAYTEARTALAASRSLIRLSPEGDSDGEG